MSNSIFLALRRRMTLTYSLVFGTACLLIVALTCGLLWLGLLDLERDSLQETASLAAAEHMAGKMEGSKHDGQHGEMNNHKMGRGKRAGQHLLPSMDKNILRILVTEDTPEPLDKGRLQEARLLLELYPAWPRTPEEIASLTATDAAGDTFHYLAAQAQLSPTCRLYVFKDISGYYGLASFLLPLLAVLLLVLLGGAVLLSWWLAGSNLQPVEEMYLKQQQFTSDASHELRTPLSVLRLAVRALSSDGESRLSPFAQKNLDIMDQESNRLERLTEELLLLTRSDSGRLGPATAPVELTVVAENVLAKMALPAAEKNILILPHLDKKITLQGHEDSLQRLLIILLDNAIKFSPEDSDIDFSLTGTPNQALLRIADPGPGISDEDKPHVTDRFYRGDKARTHSTGGTGLGLALAAAIVKQHRGSLTILDNVPHGTIMEVRLPL